MQEVGSDIGRRVPPRPCGRRRSANARLMQATDRSWHPFRLTYIYFRTIRLRMINGMRRPAPPSPRACARELRKANAPARAPRCQERKSNRGYETHHPQRRLRQLGLLRAHHHPGQRRAGLLAVRHRAERHLLHRDRRHLADRPGNRGRHHHLAQHRPEHDHRATVRSAKSAPNTTSPM